MSIYFHVALYTHNALNVAPFKQCTGSLTVQAMLLGVWSDFFEIFVGKEMVCSFTQYLSSSYFKPLDTNYFFDMYKHKAYHSFIKYLY